MDVNTVLSTFKLVYSIIVKYTCQDKVLDAHLNVEICGTFLAMVGSRNGTEPGLLNYWSDL